MPPTAAARRVGASPPVQISADTCSPAGSATGRPDLGQLLGGRDRHGGAERAVPRAAAHHRYAVGFLQGKTLNAGQIEFVRTLIGHLSECGFVPAQLLYESPYTDLDPEGVFPSDPVDELIHLLAEVQRRAVA